MSIADEFTFIARVGDQLRITVPKKVCDLLKVKVGSRLFVTVEVIIENE